MTSAGFNRRMRKTACPVVWKGCGAQSPQPHPIKRYCNVGVPELDEGTDIDGISVMNTQVILALDVPSRDEALTVLDRTGPQLKWVKIGLQLFTRYGPGLVEEVAGKGYSVLLDLKLHDIPNTVARAVQSLAQLPIQLLTVHASGGPEMLRQAEQACREHASGLPLLAVTVLTSLDDHELRAVGCERSPRDEVRLLVRMASEKGIKGFVCSPLETALLRKDLGEDVLLVTPGVRPRGVDSDEQKRVTTPAEAGRAGASHIVVGRPLLRASRPAEVLAAIQDELAS